MRENASRILVFGQLCLDMLPDLTALSSESVMAEGKLFQIGSLSLRAGGGVGNTGTALMRLGANTRCIALLGDDQIGLLTRACLQQAAGLEPPGLKTVSVSGSYTLALAPHDRDRTLLYFPGANDAFGEDSVRDEDLHDCAVVHCAYPTVLRSLLLNDGLSLRRIFERAHAFGAITSLDLTVPDRQALSGQIDWSRWLDNVLPETDVFVPSIAEMSFILAHGGLRGAPDSVHSALTIDSVQAVCEAIVNYGVQLTGVKMGQQGLYLKRSRKLRGGVVKYTSLAADRLFEFTQPAFRVQVHAGGTTGAGDCAYAGLLHALTSGDTLQQCAAFAAACGAACVMSHSGPAVLPSTEEVAAQFMPDRLG